MLDHYQKEGLGLGVDVSPRPRLGSYEQSSSHRLDANEIAILMSPGELIRTRGVATLWKYHPDDLDDTLYERAEVNNMTGVVITQHKEYVLVLMTETLGWISEALLEALD